MQAGHALGKDYVCCDGPVDHCGVCGGDDATCGARLHLELWVDLASAPRDGAGHRGAIVSQVTAVLSRHAPPDYDVDALEIVVEVTSEMWEDAAANYTMVWVRLHCLYTLICSCLASEGVARSQCDVPFDLWKQGSRFVSSLPCRWYRLA